MMTGIKFIDNKKTIHLRDGTKKIVEIKPKQHELNKKTLKELLDIHDPKSLRFMYFDAPFGYRVTAATKLIELDRKYADAALEGIDKVIIVAFSFCSPHDIFDKTIGKIQCLRRIHSYELEIRNEDDEYSEILDLGISRLVTAFPFGRLPTAINVAYAYNLLDDKPAKLANSKCEIDDFMTYVSHPEDDLIFAFMNDDCPCSCSR
jgi:hypothetical protein